jgi:hypothetical protein
VLVNQSFSISRQWRLKPEFRTSSPPIAGRPCSMRGGHVPSAWQLGEMLSNARRTAPLQMLRLGLIPLPTRTGKPRSELAVIAIASVQLARSPYRLVAHYTTSTAPPHCPTPRWPPLYLCRTLCERHWGHRHHSGLTRAPPWPRPCGYHLSVPSLLP